MSWARAWATSCLLVIGSLVLALVLGEVLIRWLAPQHMSGSWGVSTSSGLMVNRSSGQVWHRVGDREIRYEFEAPHLRGPVPEGDLTVLVVGDSFTFGWLVDDNESLVGRLQHSANQTFGERSIRFLNAGTGGWGASDYVAFIEDFGARIGPDVVLVVINSGDFERSLRHGHYEMSDSGDCLLERRPLPVSRLKRWVNGIPGYSWMLENLHILQLIRGTVVRLSHPRNRVEGSTREQQQAAMEGPGVGGSANEGHLSHHLGQCLFRRLAALADQNQMTLLVTTTGWVKVSEAQLRKFPHRRFLLDADVFFAGLDVPFFDGADEIAPLRLSEPDRYMIPNDGHPTEDGHRLIAQVIWQGFLSEQLTRCCEM